MNDDIDKLPTILEVLEELSRQEINESVGKVGRDFIRMDVGTYSVVSREEGKNIPMLFPNSTLGQVFKGACLLRDVKDKMKAGRGRIHTCIILTSYN